MARILVVGAGLTGSLCAALLRKEFPQRLLRIALWDKAGGEAGGRMATSGSSQDPKCTADLGAQYITRMPEDAKMHQSYYEDLLAHGVLRPLTTTIEGMIVREKADNFIMPQGSSSIVKHYLNKSGADVFYNHHVTQIFLKDGKWEVGISTGSSEYFDIVILTIPPPQILHLQGDIANQSTDIGPSIVVHTSVSFGTKYLEWDEEKVQQIIVDELKTIIPNLAEPASIICQKWRYSQVTNAFPGHPGQITLQTKPFLACGGDGFIHSSFDGCLDSAIRVVEALKASL